MKDFKSDFEKAKLLLKNLYLKDEVSIDEDTFNKYKNIDEKQRLVYFTILPMVTYLEYFIPKDDEDIEELYNGNDFTEDDTVKTIIEETAKLFSKKTEYYTNFNKYLDTEYYNSLNENYPDYKNMDQRIRRQHKDYVKLLKQLGNRKLRFNYYFNIETYIKLQNDNKTIICGVLKVPDKYINIFPETSFVNYNFISSKFISGHAVSITKISLEGNIVTVKYKNTWKVIFGNEGHQTITIDRGKFANSEYDFNSKIFIYGVMIQEKNKSSTIKYS